MRMSQSEKEKSRSRIIASAARIVRERGIEGASVNDMMGDAGLTHGGFYKHFGSKEALLAAALDSAFEDISAMLQPDLRADDISRISEEFKAFYLSQEHIAAPEIGCPIAALSGDIARAPASLKTGFGRGVRRIVDLLARGNQGSEQVRRERAMRQLAMMAGAVMIARGSDPETAHELLSACRKRAR